MDIPYKPTKPIQPNQQIYYYNFVDTTDFLSLKEGIQAIFGNILVVSPLDVVVNENGIYPPASPFYGNKKIASPTLIDKFQAINYVRKVLFLNIEKQFLSLQKKWGMQNPRFKNPIELFPNELDLDSSQILTEEGKPRYYLLTYRYGLESNTLRKIKARVYGLEVHVTLDAYSGIPVSFSYNHRPLDTKKAITQAYLIAPYTYDGLQDVAVAYLADYEKGLVAPYYLQMPLTAEQKKAAKETVEDTISSPNLKETIVLGSEEESLEIDTSVFVPACGLSRIIEGKEDKDRFPISELKPTGALIQFLKDAEKLNNQSIVNGVEMTFKYLSIENDGTYTIGYGHKIFKGENFDTGITVQEAEDLLLKDIKERGIDRMLKKGITAKVTQYEFDALVSLYYNTADGDKQSLISLLNSGHKIFRKSKEKVYGMFLKYRNPGSTNENGLVKRRAKEAAKFWHNDWYHDFNDKSRFKNETEFGQKFLEFAKNAKTFPLLILFFFSLSSFSQQLFPINFKQLDKFKKDKVYGDNIHIRYNKDTVLRYPKEFYKIIKSISDSLAKYKICESVTIEPAHGHEFDSCYTLERNLIFSYIEKYNWTITQYLKKIEKNKGDNPDGVTYVEYFRNNIKAWENFIKNERPFYNSVIERTISHSYVHFEVIPYFEKLYYDRLLYLVKVRRELMEEFP